MKYMNALRDRSVDGRDSKVTRVELRTFVQLLAPFAPFIAEELWERLGEKGSVHASSWPEVDEQALRASTMQIVIEVNGRVRGHIEVGSDLEEGEVEAMALASESVRRTVGDRAVTRVIYVPGRLVSLVVP
jgi:leucyl-tRNA synthetase